MTLRTTLVVTVLGASLSACADPPTAYDTASYDATECAVRIDAEATRPTALMADDLLAYLISRMPCVADPALRGLLESPDTMFYDRQSIVPGYQDSFGDATTFPVGMRPNTIRPNLINLAVPGGHSQILDSTGTFHFPFGRPTGVADDDALVINFWHVPRDAAGALLPVVHWRRTPSGFTNRIDWVFPRGTVFGELMFIKNDQGQWDPFEIRTRTRALDRWVVDAHRPFPTATDLAEAITKRQQDDQWLSSAELDALVAHLDDPDTLEPATLGATHFAAAFPTIQGAEDPLPPLSDGTIVRELLHETPFRSAKDLVWKQSDDAVAYAPTSRQAPSIVPRGYNGGLVPVDDDSCGRCHRDAGRPFMDYYSNIMAYGELWGQDETFSWHPFETSAFVNSSGAVVSFNDDNRRMRKDFVAAGLVAPWSNAAHSDADYRIIKREWTGYAYP